MKHDRTFGKYTEDPKSSESFVDLMRIIPQTHDSQDVLRVTPQHVVFHVTLIINKNGRDDVPVLLVRIPNLVPVGH